MLLLLFWSCSLFPFITYYYTTSFSFFSRCFKVNFSREFYLIHLHTSYTESTTCKSDSFRKEKRDENKKKQKKLSDFHNDDVLVLYDERLFFQTNWYMRYMPYRKCRFSFKIRNVWRIIQVSTTVNEISIRNWKYSPTKKYNMR